MAYARFIDSHIYIYPHIDGHIECAGCWLDKDSSGLSLFVSNNHITNDDQLRAHLEAHANAGHSMPEDLLQEILADPDRYGAGIDEDTN
jgi:hypothetical protein